MIDPIRGALKGADAHRGLNVRTHRHDPTKRGKGRSQFACQFEGKITSHGIADKPHPLASVLFRDLSNNAEIILTETIVIEGGGEMFRSATISLVDANAIPPGCPRFLCETPHVVGFCAAFKAMDE
jgi:hypothetical protein